MAANVYISANPPQERLDRMPKDLRQTNPKGDSEGGRLDPVGVLDTAANESLIGEGARGPLEFEIILTDVFSKFVSAPSHGIDEWWEEKNLHPDDRERAMRILRHSLETGKENDCEVRVRTKQGDYRVWEIRSTPVLDEAGKAVKLIGAIDDVTENRCAVEALRRSDDLHRAILNSIPEEVVVLDADGIILSVNDEWERFATENNVSSMKAVRPGVDYLEACRIIGNESDNLAVQAGGGIRSVLRGERSEFTMEYPCHCPNEQRWFILHAVPLRKAGGGAVVSHINITDRKRSEEKLQEAYAEIESLKDRLEQENLYLREQVDVRHEHEHIVGRSDAIKRALRKVEQVAKSETSVLVQGETGTGKELIASAIHNLSNRREHAMVKVNCGALPANLIENELFGREKGAYTGADSRQGGRFELANGSTLFLDEIGELAPALQAKLLRVLQDGEFERLGSTKTIKVDVRVIAATNRDLPKEVAAGNFREDLFYRLNVFPIAVPPLRERVEDIPLLAWAFVREFSRKTGNTIEAISKSDLEALQRYSWPGNIRELRNVIERAIILCDKPTLQIELPEVRGVAKAGTMTLDLK